MPKDTKNDPTTGTTSKDSIYVLFRFIVSLIALCVLAIADLFSEEQIPTIVYCLIGGLNGVDAYKLFKEIK